MWEQPVTWAAREKRPQDYAVARTYRKITQRPVFIDKNTAVKPSGCVIFWQMR